MDEDDSGVILLLVSKPLGGLREVGDVEGHKYPVLSSRLAEQFSIAERL